MQTRTQLSLYAPQPAREHLDAVRQVLDPVQWGLIPAHLTLCREDELALLAPAAIRSRLVDAEVRAFTLQFGRPEVFQGYGILLPCIAGEQDFHALRRHVLGSHAIRRPLPHITLAHPRNPKSPGNCLAAASALPELLSLTFASLQFIEQTGTSAWRLVQEFTLQIQQPQVGSTARSPTHTRP